jgi:hypothetical protein
VDSSVLHVEANNSDASARFVHQQVKSEIFNEESGVESKRSTVQSVQHCVSSSIGGGCAAVSLATFSVLERLASERSLVDLTILRSGKGKTVRLQLENGSRSLSAHVVNGVLVTKPVGALDSVVHVPLPIILSHISKSGIDTTLGSNSVGSGREQLGDASGLESLLSAAHSSSKAGTSSSYYDSIVRLIDNVVFGSYSSTGHSSGTANNKTTLGAGENVVNDSRVKRSLEHHLCEISTYLQFYYYLNLNIKINSYYFDKCSLIHIYLAIKVNLYSFLPYTNHRHYSIFILVIYFTQGDPFALVSKWE